MTLTRRVAIATAIAALTSLSWAQAYPNKPIRLVVPFPPGGGTDITAREISTKLTTTLGWNFVVDNRPGAGGNLGVDAVAKSAADGYTLVLGQTSNLAINPTLYSKLPYDPFKDLAPVSLVATAPLVLVVSASSPYKTLADVVSAAKAKPGAVNFASPGNGTVSHLTGELFQKAAGIKLQHVPYKGSNQALTDLIGGQVQLFMASVPTALPHIKSGRLRALAVSSAKRVADLPQVPTIDESGYKGFDASTWFGVLAPAGTPSEIVSKLNVEINKVLTSADIRKRIHEEGGEAVGGTPEQFAQLMKVDFVRWSKVVKESGAKVD